MSPQSANLIWIDLEMTGLEPSTDTIIEIATVITNAELEIVAEGPVVAVHQNDDVLASMDEWNQLHHGNSGLIERVRDSHATMAEAERVTLDFVEKHVAKGVSPMCGNSICQDRRFLARFMPTLEAYFHYRHIDVSTLKELCARWYPKVLQGFSKNNNHRALQDIHESISELRYYRTHLFPPT